MDSSVGRKPHHCGKNSHPIRASVEHPISNIKVHGECNRGSEKLEQKMMPRGRHPENVSPYTGLRVPVCKGTYTQERGRLMLQGYTMAIVPCGNPTPKKLPTGGGEWPTFRTARAQRTVRPQRTHSREAADKSGIECMRPQQDKRNISSLGIPRAGTSGSMGERGRWDQACPHRPRMAQLACDHQPSPASGKRGCRS